MEAVASEQKQKQGRIRARVPVPRCSKTNPNPMLLIPWMPVRDGDWTLRRVLEYARNNWAPHRVSYQDRQQGQQGQQISMVNVLLDGIWWEFIWDDSQTEVLRRPRLKTFQSYRPTYTGPDGKQYPTQQPYPHFICDVCGRCRPEEDIHPVDCGVDRYHASEFLVCTACVYGGALDNSRRMGYFVQEK